MEVVLEEGIDFLGKDEGVRHLEEVNWRSCEVGLNVVSSVICIAPYAEMTCYFHAMSSCS